MIFDLNNHVDRLIRIEFVVSPPFFYQSQTAVIRQKVGFPFGGSIRIKMYFAKTSRNDNDLISNYVALCHDETPYLKFPTLTSYVGPRDEQFRFEYETVDTPTWRASTAVETEANGGVTDTGSTLNNLTPLKASSFFIIDKKLKMLSADLVFDANGDATPDYRPYEYFAAGLDVRPVTEQEFKIGVTSDCVIYSGYDDVVLECLAL